VRRIDTRVDTVEEAEGLHVRVYVTVVMSALLAAVRPGTEHDC
jgi:hypothetical protein